MSHPRDETLYRKVRRKLYQTYPRHSAYRSGHLVQRYKAAFRKKHGRRKSAYKGTRRKSMGLARWFREDWRNQNGKVGYHSQSDVYRPTRRVSQKTPTTFAELNERRIRRARRTKRRKGRVRRF